MRLTSLLLLALTLLSTVNVQAALKGAPYLPEMDSRFDALERTGTGFAAGSVPNSALTVGSITEDKILAPSTDNVLGLQRIAKATWDFSVHGGSTGAKTLGVTLPAKATIVRSWIHIVTAATGTTGGTIAFSCESANNLFTATDETGSSSDTFVTGASDYTVANFKKITSACVITATIATQAYTAGKITVYAQYFVRD